MAAINPLLPCDPATILYSFTDPLSWSHKCEVAEVLSDIPFISVGILMFGVSALFFVVKRISLSTVSLFFSALLASVAAVLDLSQIYVDDTAMNTASSGRVIRAREVLFALSIGFRFLFYWSYVAEPSRKDLSAAATQRAQRFNCLIFECTHNAHNASWMRWGFPGKLVGAGLLVAIMTITALQIVWRVVPQFHQYTNVYATDAVLELLVSFMFLLKLLLNAVTFNSIDDMLVHTFSECLAPISGLLVNIAIAIGDLLYFAFTESTVGRLLQAFEVYIIVVFVMVTAFLRNRDVLLAATSSQSAERRDVVFTLPEPARGSTFRITPPLIETPRMSGIATPNKVSSREMLRRSAQHSLSHASSWLSSKIPRRHSRQGDEEVKLWNAEKVRMDPPSGDLDTELRASVDTSTRTCEERLEHVRGASADHISSVHAPSSIAKSMKDPIHSGRILHPSRADVPQTTIPQVQTNSVPLSTSRAGHTEMTTHPEVSPVHGFGGIKSFASASNSRTSLDEVLRQQSQLEQSIQALRLFSTEAFTNSSSDLDVRSVDLARSPSASQRTLCSDVSLSCFPIPPRSTSPVPPLPLFNSSSMKRIRGDRRVRLAAAPPNSIEDTHALVPPTILASAGLNSIPHTPTGEENESPSAEAGNFSHPDSGGMRCNVTSFIDDLATPGRSCQGCKTKSLWPAENEYSFGTIEAGSEMKNFPPHMLRVPRQLEASQATAKLSTVACSSRLSKADVVDEPANVIHHQFNDHSSHSLTIPQIPVADCAANGMSSSAGNPQFFVASPAVDRIQRKFVRRKPPPLLIQPYAEHNPAAGACSRGVIG